MIDLHLHTAASDGALSPAELVARAAAAGLTTISITDHDTLAGIPEARVAAARLGLRLVPGVEITGVEDERDVHLLAYFVDVDAPGLAGFLERQRTDRLRRLREIAGRLSALGFAIELDPLLEQAGATAGRSVGRPLLADALVAAGHARDRNDAFDRLLGNRGPAYVPRVGATPDEVIDIVRRAGGIVSLAHPGLTRMDELIPRLAQAGLAALEVGHSDHDPGTELRYRELAARYGLAVSAGSDFHADSGHRISALGRVTLTAGEFERLEARVP
ncbi:MAG: PHP domain-containing protein [Acidobacteriota bacterium]|nr:PHP domain-containing protein [Acidobacteriota bacterium]